MRSSRCTLCFALYFDNPFSKPIKGANILVCNLKDKDLLSADDDIGVVKIDIVVLPLTLLILNTIFRLFVNKIRHVS